jgi:hypothetical protein
LSKLIEQAIEHTLDLDGIDGLGVRPRIVQSGTVVQRIEEPDDDEEREKDGPGHPGWTLRHALPGFAQVFVPANVNDGDDADQKQQEHQRIGPQDDGLKGHRGRQFRRTRGSTSV